MADMYEREHARLVYRACELFYHEKLKVTDIAALLSREFPQSKRKVTRESVYPFLAEGRDRGYVLFRPPLEEAVARQIADKYGLSEDQITVVGAEGTSAGNAVVQAAAEVALDLIHQTRRKGRKTVGLGLGPGRGTLDFSLALSHKLRQEADLPRLRLHAITAGCPTKFPKYAPISFFNVFPGDYEGVGLFAETVVTSDEYMRLQERFGVRDAFEMRDEIDVIVSSFGELNHECDLFRWFLKEVQEEELAENQVPTTLARLLEEGAIGNVQYRPYSETGPLLESGTQRRVVTLFELNDFVEMVTRGRRHVVLLARKCGLCKQPRTAALRPLLREASLKVWSRLVLDLDMARDLLSDDD